MTNEQLIEKTKELITIPSVANNPEALRKAVELVAAIVADCPNITIERFEQNGKPSFLAYKGMVRPDTFDILLNAHVDVVPAKPEAFKPYIKQGRLYGRGALDMKGTAVVLASVFSQLVNEVPYPLGLQIVSDEEIGGYDGVRHQIDRGVRSKFVIMGEYSNNRNAIYNAARGLCWAEIAFKGRAAHGGHLWNGVNAVVKAGNFAGAVLKRYPTPEKETWTTTASIANLTTTNETYNKVPDMAILKVDFRFTQEDPVFESRKTVEEFIADIDPEAELVNLAVFEPAVNVEELNPFVQGLSVALQNATGAKAQFLGRPAASDGRHFALVNNDIIEFGLYGQHPHSDNEYVELASFEEYRTTLEKFLRNPLPITSTHKTKAAEPLHLTLLRQLVALPTETSNTFANHKALTIIERFLKTRGMYIERFESEGFSSLLATTKPNDKRPKVLLLAHTDVVPGATDQLNLTSKDGYLQGHGVSDMKFAIASYLCLVDNLKDSLESYDFGILITSDEEIGGRNGANLLVNKGLQPKVVIVPDGGENWQVQTFAKGVQWIRLESTGMHAHASRPWEGSNAINKLLAALHEIRELIPEHASPTDTTLSITTIEGGTAGNLIPAHASTLLDIRYGNADDYKHIPARIHEICKKHSVQDNILVSDPPYACDVSNPLVASLLKIITNVVGAKPGSMYSYGTTDGRYFDAVGIPSIVVAPESGGRHTSTEWLSEKSYLQFNDIIEQYIKKNAVRKTHRAIQPAKKQPYVWYAMYGTGLSKETFMHYIKGGQPEGSTVVFPGCKDKTAPLKDFFLSLPHRLYFAGESSIWGGAYVNIHPQRDRRAYTVARAYLITLDQFEEIVAQHNLHPTTALPLAHAKQRGHATIHEETGNYDEIVYCGTKDGWPIFSLTASEPHQPFMPPSLTYARLLYKGLSENNALSRQKVADYILTKPGIAKHYRKHELAEVFEQPRLRRKHREKLHKKVV